MTGLSLISDAPATAIEHLYRELWKAIFVFERRYSRFLPDSELSTLNRNAGMKQYISSDFRDLLVTARDMAFQTDGMYNPFVLPAVQATGYRHSRVPGRENDVIDDHANKTVASIDRLEIGDNWARIPYGTALDLGGIGKGYLAERLRDRLPDLVTGYWLSLGGDIAVGGNDTNGQPWKVMIESADNQIDERDNFIVATPCGVATSGTTVHRGTTAGRNWHHIIDPRTRKPAKTDVLLASVQHASPLMADVLASCAVILGSKHAVTYLKLHGVKAAVLQCKTNNQTHTISFGHTLTRDVVHA